MSKDYGYPSFELICRASSGDELAIREILKFYDTYISKLCLRPFYPSESGKIIMQVDEELKGDIYTDMMKAILKFENTSEVINCIKENREIHSYSCYLP